MTWLSFKFIFSYTETAKF